MVACFKQVITCIIHSIAYDNKYTLKNIHINIIKRKYTLKIIYILDFQKENVLFFFLPIFFAQDPTKKAVVSAFIPYCYYGARDSSLYPSLLFASFPAVTTPWYGNAFSITGLGVTKPIFSIPLIVDFFSIVKTHVKYWISRLYLTGIAAAELRWYLSNMDVIQIVYQVLLQDRKFCLWRN